MAKIRYCLKESLELLTEQEHEKILNENRISYLFKNLQNAKENDKVSANNLAQIVDKILASPFFILEFEVDKLPEKALWRLRKVREILDTFEDSFRKDEMFHYTELIEKRLIKRKCETEQLFPVRRSIEVDIENDPLANLIKKRLDTVCLGTIDEAKGPATGEPGSQTAAKVSIDRTDPAEQNPLSSLTYRQLALWSFYRQEAGEMERFDKKAAFDFAESHQKSGQSFYQNYWLNVPDTFKMKTGANINAHKAILPLLEKESPIAFNNAYKNLKVIESK